MFDFLSVGNASSSWSDLIRDALKDVFEFLIPFFLGVFTKPIVDRIRQPSIKLIFSASEEGCIVETDDIREHAHKRLVKHKATYFRVKLIVRRHTALKCRAFLVGIDKEVDGKLIATPYCDPSPLPWSGRQSRVHREMEYEPIDIPKGVSQFFDVVSVMDNDWKKIVGAVSPLEVHTKIILLRYQELFTGAGKYRFKVVVAGDNFQPKTLFVNFRWDGPKSRYTYNFKANS